MRLILATSSENRQEAFKSLGINFIVDASHIEEYSIDRPNSPHDLVLYLSKLKVEKVARRHTSGIIIGLDSVGSFNSAILEKPRTREEAHSRLRNLSGKTHKLYTGINMVNLDTKKIIQRVSITTINMRNLRESDIIRYLDSTSSYKNHALGYDPLHGYSSSFVESIDGSYNNLLYGLPIEVIVEMLYEIGFNI